MSATTKNRGARFLLTRVLTGATAVGMFVSLWAGVAITAASKNSAKNTSSDGAAAAAGSQGVIEQDGWRWDPKKQDWVQIVQPTPPAATQEAPQPVVVIERQPIYYTTYVQQIPAGTQAAPSATTTGGTPAGTAAARPSTAPGAPATVPVAPASAPPVFAAGSVPQASLPVVPPAPAAPAPAPMPASVPAPAPAAAAAPAAPPKPAAAPAPKTTRSS